MSNNVADQWEYQSFRLDFGPDSRYLDQRLNQMGAAGWELVSTSPLSVGGRWLHGAGDTNALFFIMKRRRTAP